MAELTLTEVMNEITLLSQRVTDLSLAVDDIRANLSQHRRDIGVRTTEMDLAMRAEIAVVQGAVDALKPDIANLANQQSAADTVVSGLSLKLDDLRARQDALSADVSTMVPKLDAVSAKQDEMLQRELEPIV